MKKWYIIDNCETKRASSFIEEMEAATKEKAEKELRDEWERLDPRDQRDRDEFYAAYGEDPYDPEECIVIK